MFQHISQAVSQANTVPPSPIPVDPVQPNPPPPFTPDQPAPIQEPGTETPPIQLPSG